MNWMCRRIKNQQWNNSASNQGNHFMSKQQGTHQTHKGGNSSHARERCNNKTTLLLESNTCHLSCLPLLRLIVEWMNQQHYSRCHGLKGDIPANIMVSKMEFILLLLLVVEWVMWLMLVSLDRSGHELFCSGSIPVCRVLLTFSDFNVSTAFAVKWCITTTSSDLWFQCLQCVYCQMVH